MRLISVRTKSPALAVGSGNLADGTYHAALFSGGTAHDLGTLPGGTVSNASGMPIRGPVTNSTLA